jgi:hypothetical protein
MGGTAVKSGTKEKHCSRDLYLTAYNINKRQTSTPPAGFKPTTPASEPPHTHALDCADNGIGDQKNYAK